MIDEDKVEVDSLNEAIVEVMFVDNGESVAERGSVIEEFRRNFDLFI
jgi:hypothetical protein